MRGYKVSVNHGEPRPHPKSLMAILKVLERKLGLEVELSELVEEAKRLEEALRKAGYDPSSPLSTSEEGGVALEGEAEQTQEPKSRDIYR
jgi:predicted ATP-grasp superfamily ATP-dependent carboligase